MSDRHPYDDPDFWNDPIFWWLVLSVLGVAAFTYFHPHA
jgi:hypothetical protein